MRKILISALGILGTLGTLTAQPVVNNQPDCLIFFSFSATGTAPASPGFDNRQLGCTTWNLTYSISGFSSITIALQGAPNANGTPGSYGTYPNQQILVGSNPNTITSGASFVWLFGYNPWVQVNLSAAAGGPGIVTGAAFGYRVPSASSAGGGSGGPTANVNLAQIAGTSAVAGPLAGTLAASDLCNVSAAGASQAIVALTASGNTRIVSGSSSKQIRVCHLIIQTAAPEDIKLVQGSGATCGSSTADLTGLFYSSLGIALDTLGSLTVGSGLDLCVNQSGTQNLGGIITYMLF